MNLIKYLTSEKYFLASNVKREVIFSYREYAFSCEVDLSRYFTVSWIICRRRKITPFDLITKQFFLHLNYHVYLFIIVHSYVQVYLPNLSDPQINSMDVDRLFPPSGPFLYKNIANNPRPIKPLNSSK